MMEKLRSQTALAGDLSPQSELQRQTLATTY
jgi:hypothetical protein